MQTYNMMTMRSLHRHSKPLLSLRVSHLRYLSTPTPPPYPLTSSPTSSSTDSPSTNTNPPSTPTFTSISSPSPSSTASPSSDTNSSPLPSSSPSPAPPTPPPPSSTPSSSSTADQALFNPAFSTPITAPKFPIVLCHGLLGFDRLGPFDYFRGIKKQLQTHGAVVEITSVSPTASIADRAAQLRKQIEIFSQKYNTKVHIIAHSSIADWGISRIGIRLKVLEMLKYFSIPTDAFMQLTPQYLNEVFNPETPDHPEVAYFSYGASKECQLLNPFYFFNSILWTAEGDNDGLVSVTSSRWGEYLGTIPCDHMELMNWNPLYDASPIYVKIASSLSKYESEIVKKSGA